MRVLLANIWVHFFLEQMVAFTRCLIKHRVMKIYCVVTHFLNLDIGWSWIFNVTSQLLYYHVNSPQGPLYGWLLCLQYRSVGGGENQNLCTEREAGFLRPVRILVVFNYRFKATKLATKQTGVISPKTRILVDNFTLAFAQSFGSYRAKTSRGTAVWWLFLAARSRWQDPQHQMSVFLVYVQIPKLQRVTLVPRCLSRH